MELATVGHGAQRSAAVVADDHVVPLDALTWAACSLFTKFALPLIGPFDDITLPRPIGLHPGQVVETTVGGIGTCRNTCVPG